MVVKQIQLNEVVLYRYEPLFPHVKRDKETNSCSLVTTPISGTSPEAAQLTALRVTTCFLIRDFQVRALAFAYTNYLGP